MSGVGEGIRVQEPHRHCHVGGHVHLTPQLVAYGEVKLIPAAGRKKEDETCFIEAVVPIPFWLFRNLTGYVNPATPVFQVVTIRIHFLEYLYLASFCYSSKIAI